MSALDMSWVGHQGFGVIGGVEVDTLNSLLLDIWREVGKHLELRESISTIASMLARDLTGGNLALGGVMVRRLDPQHSLLETVAVGLPYPTPFHATAKTPLSEAKLARLLAINSPQQVLHANRPKRTGDAAIIAPDELTGEIFIGPLLHSDQSQAGQPAGFLVFWSEPHRVFQPAHIELFAALLEPFAAALENDRRLHELALLREAAEADRRTLLSRLGRQEMTDVVVGSESGLKSVMERVSLVAQSDVPVLILGETGTGKEVVSRAIHQRSARGAGPFIRVNCGAIPPELVDSQLFGHERGSFTGASETRKGWFERADGGTLFLDEIGELPLPAQVRLLRVLQDSYIERVGGQQPIHVDVRIVAATHRDLASMVKSGTFREDLWYRVNVFPILLPRLRERREDIPSLARHFAQRAANRFGLAYVEPTPSDLRLLMEYPWPGNIRELGAVIDRAAILGDGKRLDVAKSLGTSFPSVPTASEIAPNEPTFYEVIPESPRPAVRRVEVTDENLGTLDQAMREHIEKALLATQGKIEGKQGAAALLGINPHTLRARMRKLAIPWETFRPN